ncbi:MAG: hypothetical protein AAFV88_25915 [Planctomycetota bacterium]
MVASNDALDLDGCQCVRCQKLHYAAAEFAELVVDFSERHGLSDDEACMLSMTLTLGMIDKRPTVDLAPVAVQLEQAIVAQFLSVHSE